tara:strand:- start:814 stop:1290 length:477 start_codon:yes stop_codon:yes gene_type:complete
MQYTPLISGGLALTVIPSDNANIPYPNKLAVGVSTNTALDEVVDASKDFTLSVNKGDIVYNMTTAAAGTVLQVVSATVLKLNANILVSGDNYIVYCGSDVCADALGGCIVRVNGTGNVTVTTMSDDVILFTVQAGEYLPIKVKKVAYGATATGIVAIW